MLLYSGPRPRPDLAEPLGATYVPFEQLLAESDFVTIHCPLNDRTRHLIDAAALRRHHPRVDEFTTAHAPDDDEIADLRARLADYDLLVLGTTAAATQPQQAALAHALLAIGVPTVAVALRAPFDLLAYPEATTQLATYSLHRPSLDALADALFGHLAPTGRLPVAIGDRAIV